MKTAYLALAALPGVAAAQTLSQPVPVRPLGVNAPNLLRPNMVALPPCLSGAIIGEEGSGEIIGEKGSTGVIGEKGSTGIIGEKGSTGIIGEKGSTAIIGEEGSTGIIGEKGSKAYSNRWNASGFTSYKHVLVGPPGRRTLSLYGCSSAGGGETVAVYLTGPDGERKTGWKHFVIATRNGNSRAGTITLPAPAQGQTLSRLPIVVVVENASGRPHVGEYRLTLVD